MQDSGYIFEIENHGDSAVSASDFQAFVHLLFSFKLVPLSWICGIKLLFKINE